MWHAAREWAGLALIVVGAAGCVLPLIPGVPLLAAGALMLGPDHVVVRRGRTLWHSVRGRFR